MILPKDVFRMEIMSQLRRASNTLHGSILSFPGNQNIALIQLVFVRRWKKSKSQKARQVRRAQVFLAIQNLALKSPKSSKKVP